MDISTSVKNLRLQSGMSQGEFAAKLGVVRQTVSRWEKGTAEPSLGDIQNMCRLFGASPQYFFSLGEKAEEGMESSAECIAACSGADGQFSSLQKARLRESKRLAIYRAFFWASFVLFFTSLLFAAVSGYTIFSENSGYDVVSDYNATFFVLCVICAVLLFAVWICAFIHIKKSKEKIESFNIA